VAKRSRRQFKPRTDQDAAGTPSEAAQQSSDASAGRPQTSRPSRTNTRARRVTSQQSPIARYRTLIIGGVAVVGLLLVGWIFFFSGSVSAAYSCDSLLTPGPVETAPPAAAATPSPTAGASDAAASPDAVASPDSVASPDASATPQPEPTARLGFSTTVLGRGHVLTSQRIEYGFCPPTSGEHYNVTGRGPIRAAVYPKTEEQVPGGWVHNLEHGWVVVLYRCTGPDDCPSDEEMAQLQAFFDQAPQPPDANCTKEVLVARFDDMDTRFAEVAWGRAMLTDTFDLDKALEFAQQWMDHDAVPEKGIC
jgi:Protein of unknown function (DUF3105)